MKNPLNNLTEADRLRALKYAKVGTSVLYSVFRYLLLFETMSFNITRRDESFKTKGI